MEREIVAGQCTEVYVPPFPSDTVELASFAEQLYREKFQTLRLTDEDFQKTQMYQQENQRNDLKVKAANIEEYIKQLSIKANIHQIRETEWERVHQLCNKTNQFNLTTKDILYRIFKLFHQVKTLIYLRSVQKINLVIMD